MAHWTGNYAALTLENGNEGYGTAQRRVSRDGARRPGLDEVEVAENASRGARYERFEPVTVRAAARVLQLQRSGVVTAVEARFYLQELADMDRHADRNAYQSLLRMAQRQAGFRSHIVLTGNDPVERALATAA